MHCWNDDGLHIHHTQNTTLLGITIYEGIEKLFSTWIVVHTSIQYFYKLDSVGVGTGREYDESEMVPKWKEVYNFFFLYQKLELSEFYMCIYV